MFYKILWCSLALSVASCSTLNKKFGLPDDNSIEEAAEDIIEYKWGVDVDLTPSSKEKK